MIDKIEVERVTCDSCGTAFYHEKDEELPIGYYIFKGVMWIHGAGGTGTEGNHFLCKKSCLVNFARKINEHMQ